MVSQEAEALAKFRHRKSYLLEDQQWSIQMELQEPLHTEYPGINNALIQGLSGEVGSLDWKRGQKAVALSYLSCRGLLLLRCGWAGARSSA